MDQAVGIAKMVLPVFVMIAIGALCRKKGVMSAQGIAGLKSFVVNVTLPAVLFGAFSGATYSLNLLVLTVIMFAVCCAALLLGRVAKKAIRSPQRTFPFLMTGFEAGMLGYALYTMLFGADHVASFASVDLGQVLFVFTVFFTLINPKHEGGALRESVKNIVRSPVMIAIAAGIAVGASGLGRALDASAAGEILRSVVSFLSAPTAAAILLVVGFELELRPRSLKAALLGVGVRVVLMGALCALVLLILGALMPLDAYLKWAVILMFTLPPPFVIPIFVDDEAENGAVSATLSLSTLVSLAAFAVIATLAV